MKKNIEHDLAAVYGTMNPFDEAKTEVVVTIKQICKKEGEESFSIAEGVSCEELASKRRKRSDNFLNNAKDFGGKVYDEGEKYFTYTKDTSVSG